MSTGNDVIASRRKHFKKCLTVTAGLPAGCKARQRWRQRFHAARQSSDGDIVREIPELSVMRYFLPRGEDAAATCAAM